MSTGSASPPPASAVLEANAAKPAGDANAAALEHCPLCGAPLHPEQEWCLHCGAAARTRLARFSNSKGPIIAVAIVAALSIAVLAVSLVKLAGNSPSRNVSITVTSTAAAATPAPTTAPATPAPKATSTTAVPRTTAATPAPARGPTHSAPSTSTSEAKSRVLSTAREKRIRLEIEQHRRELERGK